LAAAVLAAVAPVAFAVTTGLVVGKTAAGTNLGVGATGLAAR
jgi:hypothetical protein